MTMQHSHTGTYLTEVALGQAGWQAAETVGTGSMWSVELHEGDFQVQQQHIEQQHIERRAAYRAAAYRAAAYRAAAYRAAQQNVEQQSVEQQHIEQ